LHREPYGQIDKKDGVATDPNIIKKKDPLASPESGISVELGS